MESAAIGIYLRTGHRGVGLMDGFWTSPRFRPLWLGLALLVCGLASSAPVKAASGRVLIEEGAVKRSALIVEFQRLKRGPRPTIIVLHGGSGNGAGVRRNLGLDEVARATGSIMIYPDAVEGRWAGANAGRAGLADDSIYLGRLVQKLIAERISDPQKISIVGVSTGGLMAIRMACTQPRLFAAAAAIIANMPKSLEGACKPERPVPFLLINGTADTLIPYQGGRIALANRTAEVLSTEATLAAFAEAAGCGTGRSSEPVTHRDAADPTRTFIERATGCKAPVELIKVDGGGHRVPGRPGGGGGNANAGARSNDVDAGKAVLEFIKRAGG